MSLCREYSTFRSYPQTRALATIPEGTILGPVVEVHIVKILDEYGKEVAFPSICRPKDTSCVVISIETERFVNEIHDHKQELRSSNELLAAFKNQEEVKFLKKKVTQSFKATWACFPYSKEESFLRVRRNGKLYMVTYQMLDIGSVSFQRRSQQCFVILTKRNDRLMVQDIGVQLNQRWFERLHVKEHKISSKKWLRLIHEGSTSELFMDTLVIFQ